MKTRATEENIVKYYNVLNDLHLILQNTSRISMLDFSVKNKITKNLSNVLQKGGVIKKIKAGRYPEWEWVSIKPTREMAIKVLQELAKFNPDRKEKSNHGGKREGAGRKSKEIENRYLDSITFKIFWVKINVKLNYKTSK